MVHKIYRPHLSTVKDARAVRTREALRRALLELLEVKPLERISIRDIAAKSGVGYTTFFRHHPTKESLLDDVAAAQIRELVNLVAPVMDSSNNMRTVSVALCTRIDEHRKLWSTLLTGGAAGALREEYMRVANEVAVQRTEFDSWLPAEIGTKLVVSGTIELLTWWLRQADPLPIELIAEIHERIIVSPNIAAYSSDRVSKQSRLKVNSIPRFDHKSNAAKNARHERARRRSRRPDRPKK